MYHLRKSSLKLILDFLGHILLLFRTSTLISLATRAYLMNIDKTSAEKKAARLVSYDLIGWWSAKRYPTNSSQALEKMVLKNVNLYRQRKRYRDKYTDVEKKKQEDLKLRMKETYWVVQPDYEKKLKSSYEKEAKSRDTEVWLYLEGVRGGTKREATNGPVDSNYNYN